jgi:rubrerythrin
MSHLTPYAEKILASEALVDMPAPASTTIPEADMIAELQRENARLQAEADGAKDRAAHRHREMMHANRRAEKAENTLGRHTEERKAQEAKYYMLYCGYTQTIEGLEAQIKSQKTDSQKEAMDAQVKIITETEDRLRKQFEGEIGAMRSQFKQAMQVLNNQVQELKKQLQQAAQRESSQNSQIATGTRAGHPIQSQEGSNALVNAGNDKRKRQDSTGYVMAQI